jgi:hypothetical protein
MKLLTKSLEAKLISNFQKNQNLDYDIEGGYHPSEHVNWMAAQRIEDLQQTIDNISNEDLLYILSFRLCGGSID